VTLKYALGFAAAVALSSEAGAAARTFVATTGADSNTSANCGPTAPCRTFNAALSVTDAGGEVVVLNSGGYGPAPINIAKSVSITAPEGVYAGVTVASGNGFTISTAGLNVALRGLTINGPGVGGSYGIFVVVSGAVTLTVDNCVISNFPSAGPAGAAINFIASGVLRVANTSIRGNGYGISLEGASADIVHSQFFGNDVGISADAPVGGINSSAVVTDTVLSDSSIVAIDVTAQAASSSAQVSVVRSTLSNSQYGAYAAATNGGITRLSVDDSLITGDTYGLYQFQDGVAGSSAILTSFGNNAFSSNTNDEGGTITTTALK
jgi:hypothetical protein